jgi:hypothetical protein
MMLTLIFFVFFRKKLATGIFAACKVGEKAKFNVVDRDRFGA